MSERVYVLDLGRREYRETWELQRQVVRARQRGLLPDVLIFVEHPPTYTLGRGGVTENLLLSQEELVRLGAAYVETDRGGDVTYHGPGQIVGYPVVGLEAQARDVHLYLRRLEEVLLRTLHRFQIAAHRVEGLTGVWHEQGKVAAIGVRVSRWVTSHGFALNVTTDLSYFNHIVPCGIVGRNVTSMASILRQPIDLCSVRKTLSQDFSHVFDRRLLPVSEATLLKEAHVEVGKAPAS